MHLVGAMQCATDAIIFWYHGYFMVSINYIIPWTRLIEDGVLLRPLIQAGHCQNLPSCSSERFVP